MSTTDVATLIGVYLEDQGVGTIATDIFLDFMPDEPDELVSIITTTGMSPEHTMGGTTALRRPTFQVLVRNTPDGEGHATAKRTAELIYRLLDKPELTVASVTFLGISPVDEPNLIGHDENHRPIYSINFETSYVAPTGTPDPPILDGNFPAA